MTVRLRTFTVVVVLMVLFSRPEAGSRSYVGHHAIPFLLQDTDQPFGNLLLLRGSIENLRPILIAQVGSLSVELGRIVYLEKEPGKSFVRDFRRIELVFDGLGMARFMAAHLLVGGILGMAADIARTNALHSVHLTQHILPAPETSAGENSPFGLHRFRRLG